MPWLRSSRPFCRAEPSPCAVDADDDPVGVEHGYVRREGIERGLQEQFRRDVACDVDASAEDLLAPCSPQSAGRSTPFQSHDRAVLFHAVILVSHAEWLGKPMPDGRRADASSPRPPTCVGDASCRSGVVGTCGRGSHLRGAFAARTPRRRRRRGRAPSRRQAELRRGSCLASKRSKYDRDDAGRLQGGAGEGLGRGDMPSITCGASIRHGKKGPEAALISSFKASHRSHRRSRMSRCSEAHVADRKTWRNILAGSLPTAPRFAEAA